MQDNNLETILGTVLIENYVVDCHSATYTARINLDFDERNESSQDYTPVPASIKIVHVIKFNEQGTFFDWLKSPIAKTLHDLYTTQESANFYVTPGEQNIHVQLPGVVFTNIIPLNSEMLLNTTP